MLQCTPSDYQTFKLSTHKLTSGNEGGHIQQCSLYVINLQRMHPLGVSHRLGLEEI